MNTPALLASGTTRFQGLFDRPLKVGDRVTFPGDDRVWDVVEVWGGIATRFVHRSWHNNI